MAWTKSRFEHEMKKFDPLLRLRLSADGMNWLVERKCARESRCLVPPNERRGIDSFIRDRDGYVAVLKVSRDLLNQRVFLELRAHDMWHFRGAGWYADALEAQEAAAEQRLLNSQSTRLESCSSEAYDKIRHAEKRIESGFHSRVDGWEPGSK
jgi:hypothetical protein